jgi:hypothetical protein
MWMVNVDCLNARNAFQFSDETSAFAMKFIYSHLIVLVMYVMDSDCCAMCCKHASFIVHIWTKKGDPQRL